MDSRSPEIVWGHYETTLGKNVLPFLKEHFASVHAYDMPETYNRIANALRLYSVALHTMNCDLAILGFVGSLESLFSTAPQELTFRLSLVIAKFLAQNVDEERKYFKRAKALYGTRSKLAHGDKIASSEEQAAIQLVDTWTTEAEELSRKCIYSIFSDDLSEVFDSKKLHERFLEELLFLGSRKRAGKWVRHSEQGQ